MSPGQEKGYNNILFAKSKMRDFDQLCSLDVLGTTDIPEQDALLQDSKDQLQRSPEGRYETGLSCKKDTPELPDNEQESIARLKNHVQRLEKQPQLYDIYEEILKEQESEGIIEKVSEQNTEGKCFYLPHKAVRVVLDYKSTNSL